MDYSQPILKAVQLALVVIQLTACSKSVEWDEEVPLNTGETIWVTRTVVYAYQGGEGNPLDMAYRPETNESIEFSWNGKNYHYFGDARIALLAISPEKKPVLVAAAGDNAWDSEHNYGCTVPFYVQLAPDDTGSNWKWPPRVDSWLYHLPFNLLLSRLPPEKMNKRYTVHDRKMLDVPGPDQGYLQYEIDPTYTEPRCIKAVEHRPPSP